MTPRWMLYGANGYSGELIARAAVRQGLRPILAGRRAERVEPLARELGLEHRAFDLSAPEDVAAALEGMALVLHCAGPFAATSAPMIQACLQAGTHYLDISGEISVFEHAHALSAAARAASVIVCPGVAFDVVPTDCVALALKDAMPDATHLALAFATRSGFSRAPPRPRWKASNSAARSDKTGRSSRYRRPTRFAASIAATVSGSP